MDNALLDIIEEIIEMLLFLPWKKRLCKFS